MKTIGHLHDGKLSRPECLVKMLPALFKFVFLLLGIKRQLEKLASQSRPLTAFVHMVYPDAAASDTRCRLMFCEIIASNMILHDRVTDSASLRTRFVK